MKIYTNPVFETLGADGKPNGRIIRVWERGEAALGYGPGQVYVTTLLPGCSKGPHLHKKRDSLFCCVRGSVRIIVRTPSRTAGREWVLEYTTVTSGVGLAGDVPWAVYVPAGTPCQLYNAGHDEALVINVSSEPYDAEDEHEVDDWWPNET